MLHTHWKKLSLDPKESICKASCPVTSSKRNTPKLYTSLISEMVPDTPTLNIGTHDEYYTKYIYSTPFHPKKKKKKSTLKWNAIKRNWFTLDLGKHWHWTCEMDLLLQSFQVVLTPLHLKPWQCSSNQPRHLLFWSYCAPREVLGHVSGTNLH